MASALAALLGRYAFDPPLPQFANLPAAGIALATTVAITNGAGWITGISLFALKPAEVLRRIDT
jgi:hypothetical protein